MKNQRRLLWLVGAVSLIAALSVGRGGLSQASEDAPLSILPPEQGTLRIGGFNMYWLGSPNMRRPCDKKKPNPNIDKHFNKVAQYISASGVDVLAISEVHANIPARKKSKELNIVLDHLYNNHHEKWDYRLFTQVRRRTQCTGVLWNTGRAYLKRAYYMRVDRRPPGYTPFAIKYRVSKSIHDRKVYAAHFSAGAGKTDFMVMPLHLKSNMGGVKKNRARRYYEAKTILDALPKTAFKRGEYDVILIGDTNVVADKKEAFELNGETTSAPRYITSWRDPDYFRELGGDEHNTHLDCKPGNNPSPSRVSPFDRAYIPTQQPEFKNSEFNYLYEPFITDEEYFKDHISDHLLIYFDITVMKDDDSQG